MEDASNQNTFYIGAVEDDVPPVLHATQAATNVSAASACLRVVGKHLATASESGDVAERLIHAPGSEGVSANASQVGFGAT